MDSHFQSIIIRYIFWTQGRIAQWQIGSLLSDQSRVQFLAELYSLFTYFYFWFLFLSQMSSFSAPLGGHRFKSSPKRAIFHPHPPVIFIKWICFVFWCLLGYIGWKLAESGGNRSKMGFLQTLFSNLWPKCHYFQYPFSNFKILLGGAKGQ